MQKKTKEKISCAVLIIGGLSLCIAGIWMPPLLVLGGALIAGGLTILSNYLQDKDRFTVNNYGDIRPNQPTRAETVRATRKQKQAALFAFKNSKYKQHHDEMLNSESESAKMDVTKHDKSFALSPEMVQQIKKLNEVFNLIDSELLKAALKEDNISHESEKKALDAENNLKL